MTDKERRFWEKCGFTVKDTKIDTTVYGESHPENIITEPMLYSPNGELADPDINSLDDLMKYAVPKVTKKNTVRLTIGSKGTYCYIIPYGEDCSTAKAQADTPAQALYETLCKALEVEG